MKLPGALYLHGGLVVLSAALAFGVWTRDKSVAPNAPTEATIWSGSAAAVESIAFEGHGKKVVLESRTDADGRWFFGTLEKDAPLGADAGAAGDKVKTTFASATAGQKLAELVAPLKSPRALGKLAQEHAAEFGLAPAEGTLTVRIAGAEHKLSIGGPTPGGTDRYVLDPSKSEVFVVKGDVYSQLESADSRLVERDLHGWKEIEIAAAVVAADGKTRRLVRGGAEGKKFWADPSAADKSDETAGNWMQKLERVRPVEYVASPPAGAKVVVRVDYASAGGKLGWIELTKSPGDKGKFDYWVASEHTRLVAKVAQTSAEQVEQDVASIVR